MACCGFTYASGREQVRHPTISGGYGAGCCVVNVEREYASRDKVFYWSLVVVFTDAAGPELQNELSLMRDQPRYVDR